MKCNFLIHWPTTIVDPPSVVPEVPRFEALPCSRSHVRTYWNQEDFVAAGGHIGLGGPNKSDPLLIEAGRRARELIGERPLIGSLYKIDPAAGWVSAPQPYEDGDQFWLEAAQPRSELASQAEISLVGVSNDLVAALAGRPELHWRKFEELIAELLARSGFEVQLTSGSRDRGVDIYAVAHGTFGRMLYVVECKRYAPNRGVSPGLVRQLYGVVERERATQGLLATTSFFTTGACSEQRDLEFRIGLRDFQALRGWLREVHSGG